MCARYATEVDVDFVRKSVRAIGRLAVKIESAADKCISALLELIQTKVNYVVQEAIIVIRVIRGRGIKLEYILTCILLFRTSLENIPINMKALFQPFARTWTTLMNLKLKHP